MAVEFEETEDYFPRIPMIMLALVIAASELFLIFCIVMGYVDDMWAFAVITVLFVAFLIFAYLFKVRIKIEDGILTVRAIKTLRIDLKRTLDVKKGDIDVLRNYSGWGIKKVKFKTYSCPGIDDAVSVKLGGKFVLTMTTAKADELYTILSSYKQVD